MSRPSSADPPAPTRGGAQPGRARSYDLPVRKAGYSLDRFERWLARTLIAAVLEPDQR